MQARQFGPPVASTFLLAFMVHGKQRKCCGASVRSVGMEGGMEGRDGREGWKDWEGEKEGRWWKGRQDGMDVCRNEIKGGACPADLWIPCAWSIR